jgi:hypothetical protein
LSTGSGGRAVGSGSVGGTLGGVKPLLHRAADLRATGYGEDDIRRLLRSGVLTPVRRGAYVERPPDDRDACHALLLQAAVAELGPGAVASHASAAVVHGLPTWGLPLERAHVTFDRRTGGRLDDRLHVHTAPLHPDDVVMVDGLAVTSRARTVVDIARRAQFEPAVAVADAALLAALRPSGLPRGALPAATSCAAGGAAADPSALRAALDAVVRRAKGWPGVPAARQVMAFADGRAESVGESRSRIAIARAGLPRPVLQLPVALVGGTAYADFGWPEQRTLGEFDGKVKYGRLLKPGQDPGDVVYDEKLREDEIRALDWEVVRWRWADLRDFASTASRIRSRFRG